MAKRLSRARAQPDPAEVLAPRIRALAEAADAATGRVDEDAVGRAVRLVEQADRRLAFSGAATVVALAGATGSGKSSLFNVLSGSEVAIVGIRRPTTSRALAGVWGSEPTEELLEWLEIPRRHAMGTPAERVDDSSPRSANRTGSPGEELDGLVLLDLPDHDSTEVSHRLEVDRLVELVDAMVWVVDPQKYADAALHDRYLRSLVRHAGVMTVVLNQIDRLNPGEREACVSDLSRLLASEGLGEVEVLAVSADTGEGIDRLRSRLVELVTKKKAAARRLAADVEVAADRLSDAAGSGGVPELGPGAARRLDAALGQAAGVPVVSDAVGKAWRRRGGLATGWPVLSWLARFRPDPLRRLHLDRLPGGRKQPAALDAGPPARTSLPATTGVQRAGVDLAVRAFADDAATGLSRRWSDAVKEAARSETAGLPDRLDRAIAGTDLDLDRHRGWWRVVRALQWVFVLVVVVGLGWLAAAVVLRFLQLPPLPAVTWWDLPAPTVLLVGGVLAGLITAGLARIGVEVGARRRERAAARALRQSIADVSDELVIAPVQAELDRYARFRDAVDRARSLAGSGGLSP
jgi:GTP-binding protein EngB required for normal cell division